eukprot:COSAG05_NODE_8350_length_712_cov_0.662316_1_plen_109_part_10
MARQKSTRLGLRTPDDPGRLSHRLRVMAVHRRDTGGGRVRVQLELGVAEVVGLVRAFEGVGGEADEALCVEAVGAGLAGLVETELVACLVAYIAAGTSSRAMQGYRSGR